MGVPGFSRYVRLSCQPFFFIPPVRLEKQLPEKTIAMRTAAYQSLEVEHRFEDLRTTTHREMSYVTCFDIAGKALFSAFLII